MKKQIAGYDSLHKLQSYTASYMKLANECFTALVERYPQVVIYTKEELFSTIEEMGLSSYIPLLQDIYEVEFAQSMLETTENRNTIVPSRGTFTDIIGQEYVGADGKTRKTLTKYIPKHIYGHLEKLIKPSCSEINSAKTYDEPLRPGLIVDSGYRSAWYQTIVIVRNIVKLGLPEVFKYITLPGYSQHSDNINTAVDFTIIGDSHGQLVIDQNTGRQDSIQSFEQSLEFEYLLKHGPECGFWLSYHPDPDNPLLNTTKSKIVFEPWHWQYVGESAKDLMKKYQVYESLAIRKRSRTS